MSALRIGEVADRTGLAVSAVRYYDEIGVIAAVERVGGKRRFSEASVGQVNFIRRAQSAGFSLDEIRVILDDTDGRWREVVDEKILELTAHRLEVDEMLGYLAEMRDCGCEVASECPRGRSC